MTPQQIVLLVGWLVVMAVIIAAVLVLARRNERMLESAWREFAERSGHDWIEARGTWPNKQVFAVTGSIDGVSFKLDRYFVSTGKSRIPYTRARGTAASPLAEKVRVRTRNFLNRLNDLFSVGQPAVATGDTSFDARMIVRSKSRDAALSLLDAEARRALLAFPRALRLDAQEIEVVVSWRAAERTPANLEAGCRLIALLCRKH